MRLHRLIVPFVTAAVFVPLGITSADAAPTIRFYNARYDPAGSDVPITNTKA